MDKLLSIIVPTYNMEHYLRKCLNSLIVETSLMNQIEVLVINDGSTDNSSMIAHEYAIQFPNTFRVVDKRNGHYGSCVNEALKLATGKYVKLLDADDSFDTEAFSLFLRKIAGTDVDMILTDYVTINEVRNESSPHQLGCKGIDPYQTYAFSYLYTQKPDFIYYMWNVTYKLSLVKNMHYVQTEGIPYTDTEWVYKVSSQVKSVTYFPVILYRYLIGRAGQSVDPIIVRKSLPALFKVLSSLARFYEEGEFSQESSPFLRHCLFMELTAIYCKCLFERGYDLNLLRQFDAELKQYPKAYQLSMEVRGFRNFYCIAYWRKHDYAPLPAYYKWIRKLGMQKYKLRRLIRVLS